MRLARVDKNRRVEVPTTWAEGEAMLRAAMNGYHNQRGHNLTPASVAAKVAFGMFGEHFLAADPTNALVWLLRRICERKGAGLNEPGGPLQKDECQ
jgi:hypothetical protein